jgi:alanyl-tRNA synthetase
MLDPINAWGENTSTFSEAILSFASNLNEPRIPVSLERGVSKAGKFIGAIAKICAGGGGGRPNLAQAGGRDASKLSEALAKAKSQLTSSLQ